MTSSTPRKKVLMFVLNELIYDARVLKMAGSLSRDYEVLLVGVWLRKFDFDQEAERKKWPFEMVWVDLARVGKLPRNLLGYAARYAKIFREIVKIGKSFQPDFVHAHEIGSLPIGRTIQKSTGGYLIYDAHELYRDTVSGTAWYWQLMAKMETRVMAHCDGIIACNDERASIMYEEYGAPFLPTVISNMPPRQEYVPSTLLRDKIGPQSEQLNKLVLYQGAIMEGRGLAVLPEVLTKLPSEIGIVLIGGVDEAYKARLGLRAKELSVEERFFLLPPVLQTELFPFTCSADVGIVSYQNTCRNNYYCAPNKLYEYSAAGLPMIGSNLPPVKAYLRDNEVGAVFEADNVDSIVAAIETVCGDEAAYQEYRDHCFAAAATHTWGNQSEVALRQLYTNLEKDGSTDGRE